jgi:hypothetical protein
MLKKLVDVSEKCIAKLRKDVYVITIEYQMMTENVQIYLKIVDEIQSVKK